jgi:hypothetical protein
MLSLLAHHVFKCVKITVCFVHTVHYMSRSMAPKWKRRAVRTLLLQLLPGPDTIRVNIGTHLLDWLAGERSCWWIEVRAELHTRRRLGMARSGSVPWAVLGTVG